jgi:hypothetical protein
MSCRCFSRFFRSIYQFSIKIGRFPAKPARKLPRRFSEKSADLLVFPVFTDFYRFFQKLTGSVTSGFRSSAEFSNTASGMTFFQNQCFLQSSTISSIGTPFVSGRKTTKKTVMMVIQSVKKRKMPNLKAQSSATNTILLLKCTKKTMI